MIRRESSSSCLPHVCGSCVISRTETILPLARLPPPPPPPTPPPPLPPLPPPPSPPITPPLHFPLLWSTRMERRFSTRSTRQRCCKTSLLSGDWTRLRRRRRWRLLQRCRPSRCRRLKPLLQEEIAGKKKRSRSRPRTLKYPCFKPRRSCGSPSVKRQRAMDVYINDEAPFGASTHFLFIRGSMDVDAALCRAPCHTLATHASPPAAISQMSAFSRLGLQGHPGTQKPRVLPQPACF